MGGLGFRGSIQYKLNELEYAHRDKKIQRDWEKIRNRTEKNFNQNSDDVKQVDGKQKAEDIKRITNMLLQRATDGLKDFENKQRESAEKILRERTDEEIIKLSHNSSDFQGWKKEIIDKEINRRGI